MGQRARLVGHVSGDDLNKKNVAGFQEAPTREEPTNQGIVYGYAMHYLFKLTNKDSV